MTKVTLATLKKGYVVGIALEKSIADLSFYVGEIQEIDSMGIRVTLFDWIIGMMTGFDMFIPWTNIVGISVCTEEHNLKLFVEYAGKEQSRHEEARKRDMVQALYDIPLKDFVADICDSIKTLAMVIESRG